MQQLTTKTGSAYGLTTRPAWELVTATPPAQGPPNPTERRNLASRLAVTQRVMAEYNEAPGLRLTVAQAQRLFWLREDVCVRVLDALVDAGLLRRDEAGAYARHDVLP